MTIKVAKINNMLTKAVEENGTEFFRALGRIQGKTGAVCLIEGKDSIFKCEKKMKQYLAWHCSDELLIFDEINNEESCHLMAYTLKMMEVHPKPNMGKNELRTSIGPMFETLQEDSVKLYAETKDIEYLEGYFKAYNMAQTWEKILKLYDEIYNPHFDYIW